MSILFRCDNLQTLLPKITLRLYEEGGFVQYLLRHLGIFDQNLLPRCDSPSGDPPSEWQTVAAALVCLLTYRGTGCEE